MTPPKEFQPSDMCILLSPFPEIVFDHNLQTNQFLARRLPFLCRKVRTSGEQRGAELLLCSVSEMLLEMGPKLPITNHIPLCYHVSHGQGALKNPRGPPKKEPDSPPMGLISRYGPCWGGGIDNHRSMYIYIYIYVFLYVYIYICYIDV